MQRSRPATCGLRWNDALNDVAANVWLSGLGKAFLHYGLRGITYHSPVRPASSLSASIRSHGWVDMVLPTEAIRADSGTRNSGSIAWKGRRSKSSSQRWQCGSESEKRELCIGARKGSMVQRVRFVPSVTVAANKRLAPPVSSPCPPGSRKF